VSEWVSEWVENKIYFQKNVEYINSILDHSGDTFGPEQYYQVAVNGSWKWA